MAAAEAFGSTSTLLTRTDASPESFGFETGPELEEFVDELRAQASSEVERYCQRRFRRFDGHVDHRRGNATDTITTKHYPVIEINEIRVDGRTLPDDAYRLEDASAMPKDNAGEIERVDRVRRWPQGREIVIDYDWGFETPPRVVDDVVEDMVFETLERSFVARASAGKQSESMDGYSATWDVNDAGDHLQLTEGLRKRLDPLRRRGIP